MSESQRQLQIATLLQKDLSFILRKDFNTIFENNLATISSVVVTKDLGIAKVYISFLYPEKQEELIQILNNERNKIRYKIGLKLKKNMRKIPELKFFCDDTINYVDNIEKIISEIKTPKS